jgi:hypothetical protein
MITKALLYRERVVPGIAALHQYPQSLQCRRWVDEFGMRRSVSFGSRAFDDGH